MEYEITNSTVSGRQMCPRWHSHANDDPRAFAARHDQASFIPDEDIEPEQQMS